MDHGVGALLLGLPADRLHVFAGDRFATEPGVMPRRFFGDDLEAGQLQFLAQPFGVREMGDPAILQLPGAGISRNLLALAGPQISGTQPATHQVATGRQNAPNFRRCLLPFSRRQVARAMDVHDGAKGPVRKRQLRSVRQHTANAAHGVPRNVQAHHVVARLLQGAQEFAVAAAQLQNAPTEKRRQRLHVTFAAPRRHLVHVEPIPWVEGAPHDPGTVGSHKGPPARTPVAKRRNKGEEKRIARNRVQVLLDRARAEALGPDADLADRYTAIARRVSTRYQLKAQPHLKIQVCKGCTTYRVPGRTSRTRIHSGRIVTTCLQCGRTDRHPLQES